MGSYPKYLVKGELNGVEEMELIDFISKYYHNGWGSFSKIFDYGITEININVIRDYTESKIIKDKNYVCDIINIMYDKDMEDEEKIGELRWIMKDAELFQDLFDLFCIFGDKLRIVSDYVAGDYEGWNVVDVKRELVYYGDDE